MQTHPIDSRIAREQRIKNIHRRTDYYVREWRYQCGVKPKLVLTRFAPSSKNSRMHLLMSDLFIILPLAAVIAIAFYLIKH